MNINKIDFNKLFYEQKSLVKSKNKTSKIWDKKAPYMQKRVKNSIYNKQLINHIKTKGCKTFLDIGCGTGNISLNLNKKFKNIYALDYSLEMLKIYLQNAKDKKIKNINTYIMDWSDDFKEVPPCDIVLASRSMQSLIDIEKYLLKLDSYSKKYVYLTFKTKMSFHDKRLLKALDIKKHPEPDYIYLLNILYKHEIYAELNFIEAENNRQNQNYEAYKKSIQWELGLLNEKQKENLKKYYKKHIENKKAPNVKWALLSWEKNYKKGRK